MDVRLEDLAVEVPDDEAAYRTDFGGFQKSTRTTDSRDFSHRGFRWRARPLSTLPNHRARPHERRANEAQVTSVRGRVTSSPGRGSEHRPIEPVLRIDALLRSVAVTAAESFYCDTVIAT